MGDKDQELPPATFGSALETRYREATQAAGNAVANARALVSVDVAGQSGENCTCKNLMQLAASEKEKLINKAKSGIDAEYKKAKGILQQAGLLDKPNIVGGPDGQYQWDYAEQIRASMPLLGNITDRLNQLADAPPHTFLKGDDAIRLSRCERKIGEIADAVESAQGADRTASYSRSSAADATSPTSKDFLQYMSREDHRYAADAARRVLDLQSSYCKAGDGDIKPAERAEYYYDNRSAAEAFLIGAVPYAGAMDAAGEAGTMLLAKRPGAAFLAALGFLPGIGKGISSLRNLGRGAGVLLHDAGIISRAGSRAEAVVARSGTGAGERLAADEAGTAVRDKGKLADDGKPESGQAVKGSVPDDVAKACGVCRGKR